MLRGRDYRQFTSIILNRIERSIAAHTVRQSIGLQLIMFILTKDKINSVIANRGCTFMRRGQLAFTNLFRFEITQCTAKYHDNLVGINICRARFRHYHHARGLFHAHDILGA